MKPGQPVGKPPPPPKDSACAVFSTLFVLLVMLAQFPAKIACAVMSLVSPSIHGSASYCVATIYAASIMNVWLWKLMKHREHMSGNRYVCSKLVVSPPFLLFLLDQLVLLLPFVLKLSYIELTTNQIISVIFLICNVASFYITVSIDTWRHEATAPGLDEQYTLKDTKTTVSPDNQLNILQSEAYCIVISNIRTEPVEGNIKIIRNVSDEDFEVRFTLAVPLQPGFNLKLVPEGKAIEGAVELKGYSSFGQNRGAKIETKLFIDGNSTPSVIKTEIYELPAGALKEYMQKKQDEIVKKA